MGAASGTLSLCFLRIPSHPSLLCLSDALRPRDINNFFSPPKYDVRHVLLKLRDRRHWSGQVMMISSNFFDLGTRLLPCSPSSHLSSQPAITLLFLSHTFHLGPLRLTFRRESPSSLRRSNSDIPTWFLPTKSTRHHGAPPPPSEP